MGKFIPTPDALLLNRRNAIRYPKYINADRVDSFYIEQTSTTDGFTFAVCAESEFDDFVIRAGFESYEEAEKYLAGIIEQLNAEVYIEND